MHKFLFATLALMTVALPAGAQTLDKSTFRDEALVSVTERPQDTAPFVTRADLLTAIFAADRSAVTSENLLLWHALASGQGCADYEAVDSGAIPDPAPVVAKILEDGVSRPGMMSLVGKVSVQDVSNKVLQIDALDIEGFSMPGTDQGYCQHLRLGKGRAPMVRTLSVHVPFAEVPMFSLGRDGNAEIMRAAQAENFDDPQLCIQAVASDIQAQKSGTTSYDVALIVDRIRVGLKCETEVSVTTDVKINMYEMTRFEDYVATFMVDPADGKARWGRERFVMGENGQPVIAFEALK